MNRGFFVHMLTDRQMEIRFRVKFGTVVAWMINVTVRILTLTMHDVSKNRCYLFHF